MSNLLQELLWQFDEALIDTRMQRAIALRFGISSDSVDKMIVYSAPPGYRRTAPIKRRPQVA